MFSILKKQLQRIQLWFIHASVWKKIFVLCGIILLVGVVLYRFVRTNTAAIQYQTTTVERGNIISTISASGSISTVGQTAVTSPTDGVITEVYVKNGDAVVSGQHLFSVKSTATPQEKQQAYADLLNAQNAVSSAIQNKQALQATLEQSRAVVISASSNVTAMQNNLSVSQPNPATKQPYTQNEIDLMNSALTSARQSFTATETKYNQADTSIAAANASLGVSHYKYAATQDSIVTSPIDGTVANLSALVGTNVAASSGNTGSNTSSDSSTSTTATTILVLGNFGELYIKTPITEVDVSKVKPAQKVTVTLDAFSDKTYVGTVSSVDTIGTISSGVVTFNAYITLVSPPTTVQPGMTASSVIQLERADDVLFVPTSAIQTTTEEPTVRVLKNGKETPVVVQTGLVSDESTEVISGLSEGDTIIMGTTTPATRTTGSTTTTSPFGGTNRGFGGAAAGGATRIRIGN